MVYYGSEAGMWGGDDPCDRMPMVWPGMNFDPQEGHPLGRQREPDPVAFDEGLFNFYRAAIALRRESAALRRGDIEFIAADDAEGFLAFRRTEGDETLLVALNRGDAPYTWTIPLGEGQNVSQVFTASGDIDQFQLVNEAGKSAVTVPAVDGVVLQVSPKE
jgi:glycosidase